MRGSISKTCRCRPETDARGRKKVCRRDHGSWSFIIDIGIDPISKKRQQLRRRGFRTRSEAEVAMNKSINELQDGLHRTDRNHTVGSWLDAWLAAKERSLRPTTMRDYRRHVDRYIRPAIGEVRLRDLRTPAIRSLLARMQVGSDSDAPVGVTTIRRVHATLRSALSDAVREDLVAVNPATNARPPRQPRPKVNPWSPEELGRFLDALGDHRFAVYFEVVALTGLRRGEAAGLRWSDLDLDRGVLQVHQQVTHMDGICPTCGELHRGAQFGPPKTSSGEARRVDLGQHVVQLLLTHRARQNREKLASGEVYSDHDLVFAREDGTPVNPTYFTTAFGQLCEKAGVRRVRLHDLRHGMASLLMASGTDIAVVSKMLGHSSIAITADTYSHLMEGIGRRAADAADDLVPRSNRAFRDQSVTSRPEDGDGPAAAEAAAGL